VQVVIAALLAVYFFFTLQHIASEPFFSRIGRFEPTAYDLFYALFVIVTAFYFVRRSNSSRRDDRLPKATIFWTVNTFVFLTYVSLLSHLYNDGDKAPTIAITIGYLATVGWIYTNYMNMRNAQRAHTMNVLMQIRTNTVLNEHRLNYLKRYPRAGLTDADLPALKQEQLDPKSYNITSSNRAMPVLDSIRYMANLYEFISVGMKQGDLDESIIRMSLRAIMIGFYDQVEPWIKDVRSGQHIPTAYEHYTYYVERFKKRLH
jgi:hypothetical protein